VLIQNPVYPVRGQLWLREGRQCEGQIGTRVWWARVLLTNGSQKTLLIASLLLGILFTAVFGLDLITGLIFWRAN
jgi:hypothetical protein